MLYSFLVFIGCLVYWGSKASALAPAPHHLINNANMWNVMSSSPLILPLTIYSFTGTVLASVLFFYHLIYVVGGGTTTAALVKHDKTIAWRHSPWDHMSIFANLDILLFSKKIPRGLINFQQFIPERQKGKPDIEIV